MKATCKFPGKDWDDKYNPGSKKTQAKFILEDGEEVSVNASNPESPKALFLKGLRRGDEVLLSQESFHKDGEKKLYWDIDVWALVQAQGSPSASSGSTGKKSFMEAFDDSSKRAKWFQEQGIELAKEVAEGLSGADGQPLVLPATALFERGGALGTSLHMDMIAKGYR